MTTAPRIEDILEQIRERAKRRRAEAKPLPPVPATSKMEPVTTPVALNSHLEVLSGSIACCNAMLNEVGAVNPRKAGLHNTAIQLVKKGIARSLGWYTRSIRRFDVAVTGALEGIAAALGQLQSGLKGHETRAHAEVESVREQLHAEVESVREQLHAEVESVREQLHAQHETIDRFVAEFADRTQAIENRQREVLQINDSAVGPKARAGLWFNEPIAVEYDTEGHVSWSTTNERIIEKSWVFRHFPPVFAGIRVLDIGCTESLAPLELASNGYRVTGIDVRPCPLHHPNFNFVLGDFCHSGLAVNSFDVVLALSTVEHIGLGAYGDPSGESLDQVAMREVHRVLKNGGWLFLTVPFGRRAVTPLHRIYDLDSLRSLLQGFEPEVIEYGVKVNGKTWISPAAEEDAILRTHNPTTYSPGAVALVACRKVTG